MGRGKNKAGNRGAGLQADLYRWSGTKWRLQMSAPPSGGKGARNHAEQVLLNSDAFEPGTPHCLVINAFPCADIEHNCHSVIQHTSSETPIMVIVIGAQGGYGIEQFSGSASVYPREFSGNYVLYYYGGAASADAPDEEWAQTSPV